MTISAVSKQSEGPGAWRLSWSSDAQPVRVYRDGTLVDTTRANTRLFQVPVGEYAGIELRDADDTETSHGKPRRIKMQWTAEPDADYYRIEEYVDAAWVLRWTCAETGQTQYTWRSFALNDSTNYSFRVVPVGKNHNYGTAATTTVLMVRHPDTPDIEHSYRSETRIVTISEAT